MPRERFDTERLKRSGLKEVIFPLSCGRAEYFIRGIIYSLLTYGPVLILMPVFENTENAGVGVAMVALMVLQLTLVLLGCVIPRLRDLGWSLWAVLLTLIPGVHVFMSLVLLLAPGKPIR